MFAEQCVFGMTNFVFDRDLAEELFSTETPTDYSSEEGEIHGLRAD